MGLGRGWVVLIGFLGGKYHRVREVGDWERECGRILASWRVSEWQQLEPWTRGRTDGGDNTILKPNFFHRQKVGDGEL